MFSVSVNLRIGLSAHVARSLRPCTLSIRFARSHRRPSTSSAPSVSSARRPLTSFTRAYESDPPPAQVVQSRPRRPPRHSLSPTSPIRHLLTSAVIRPVSRHIVHSSLLHRFRCPSPSASSALFVRPNRPSTSPALIVVQLLRPPHLCLRPVARLRHSLAPTSPIRHLLTSAASSGQSPVTSSTHVCFIGSVVRLRPRRPFPSSVHVVHPLRLLSSSVPCTFIITLHSADTFLPGQPVTTAVPKS